MILKRIFALVLSVISMLTITVVSGCGKANGTSESVKEEDISPSKVVTFSDFEKFNPDFQLLRIQDGFGKIVVNKNTEFVKSGKQSAEVRPLGKFSTKAKPFMYFQLESELYEYSYSDIDYLYSASMWIYNAQAEEKQVEIGIITHAYDLRTQANQTCGITYNLKSGWNKLTYFVEKDNISIPIGGTKIQGLYLQFENIPSLDINDAPTYYIDDVSLTLKTKYRDILVEEPTYSPLSGEEIQVPTATIEGGEVTYTVVNKGKVIPVTNGKFIPTEGGEHKIIYKAIVDGFIFKKTISIFVKSTNAVQIVDFANQDCLKSLRGNGHVENIDWLSEFEGEQGVARVEMNRDWPQISFDPILERSAYEGCEYVVMRLYFAGGRNQMKYIKFCNTAYPEGYDMRVEIDKWVSYVFPMQAFLDLFENPNFYGNTTDYQVHGYFYIADIYAM